MSVDGETVEIGPADDLTNRRYLWVPSLNAVFGGALVFSGVLSGRLTHRTSDKIATQAPAVVVPGPLTPAAKTDLSAVEYVATATAGVFGSSNLRVQGEGRRYKVRRVS